ncbi:E22 family MetX-like putative esterase [Rhizobium ruizarguesonis]|uniref:E22 family MetX-like putative esterase n=1 Tax=Rhizobium ruizarguesonis TaxID=2081791 RepID=UPI0010305ABE|nr:homoserine O-acetyltransferase [Rhizobium ruizarguesonis]TBC88660.1 homoserine O-acetyltransferase [Rhizobium ruizarguesonis]TBD07761.1 homoserine O-acetyltransferase [Rhizobium ruizarguesonis]TBD24695.1 homoserine O-acetyltransferase [Rhizobium ruizarguesonis]TBD33576.1 homoserine O-acetyltransferase [Rhizobium ruizarguesonis]TBD50488.1 homoserine O-acetyltransferase [Rhizobium ruizarguesonis]
MRLKILITVAMMAGPALAYEPLVEKREFTLKNFATRGGRTVPEMRLGYETYGTLNDAKDNAILIPHYFSGNSHAAGKYKEADVSAGYWDAIIGSGKPIDTDKYFVVSVDTPVNLGANDPNVITTGPATINPKTGKPWGMDFPIMTIGDFVDTQKGLMERLGIEKWHAVMGASMGGLQSYEWAARYPDKLERVIPVISSGWADANLIAWLDVWASPIKLDPNWNGGDYYTGQAPKAGLAQALKTLTLQANSAEWTDGTFGRNWAIEGADPGQSWANDYKVVMKLNEAGAARVAQSDANHFLYLARANQLFVAAQPKDSLYEGLLDIDVPVMLIYTDEDLIFPGNAVRETGTIIKSDGTPVEFVELEGTRGHMDGLLSIAQAGERIRAFLEVK